VTEAELDPGVETGDCCRHRGTGAGSDQRDAKRPHQITWWPVQLLPMPDHFSSSLDSRSSRLLSPCRYRSPALLTLWTCARPRQESARLFVLRIETQQARHLGDRLLGVTTTPVFERQVVARRRVVRLDRERLLVATDRFPAAFPARMQHAKFNQACALSGSSSSTCR